MGKVLVIEDEHFTRLAIERYVRSMGHEVLSAENGQVGLNIATDAKPDLVLVDLMMPVMDGITFVQRFRENKTHEGVPVIALTALADKKYVLHALQCGVQEYLLKPINPNALREKIRVYLPKDQSGKKVSRERAESKKASKSRRKKSRKTKEPADTDKGA